MVDIEFQAELLLLVGFGMSAEVDVQILEDFDIQEVSFHKDIMVETDIQLDFVKNIVVEIDFQESL